MFLLAVLSSCAGGQTGATLHEPMPGTRAQWTRAAPRPHQGAGRRYLKALPRDYANCLPELRFGTLTCRELYGREVSEVFAVIFEVTPKQDRFDAYLETAKQLKPELEKIQGFIDNERFVSQRSQHRILSVSTWRDEKALVRWRTLDRHHQAQQSGRFDIFEDYHLRVGEITADSDVPAGQRITTERLDETAVGHAKALTVTEISSASHGQSNHTDLADTLGLPDVGSAGVIDQELFESIYTPAKQLLLVGWRSASAARKWRPDSPRSGTLRHRQVRVVRDYGMHDRREAPQYYPPVPETALRE